MINMMTKEQLDRWEAYKDSTFVRGAPKETLRKVYSLLLILTVQVMIAVSKPRVAPEAVVVMGGIAKVFVCEVIECARSVMDEWGDTGPIRPAHLREVHFRVS